MDIIFIIYVIFLSVFILVSIVKIGNNTNNIIDLYHRLNEHIISYNKLLRCLSCDDNIEPDKEDEKEKINDNA